ncbi:hypothetical protein F8O07_06915 [Pseudoclavibacter sp. CFCC 13796]|uniref:hypothetical protein n=1 Tax=Pseudoclavibacter sp. CFCC 13796 TaxID=2615179 RepID=UPI0013013BC3|nr:hypothetical protein [Pseudoclavibacter sp. CFCC 13796]KAB1661630.1 hypothetical protein F8O07_06915 [Pseudoclavibacter sp. CFCC 13796]
MSKNATTFDESLHPRGNQATGHAGQFAVKEQSASEVTLQERPRSRYRRLGPKRTVEGLSDAEVFDVARRQIFNYASKWGLSGSDRDEALGDLLLDLAAKQHNGKAISGALINVSARAVASRYVNGPHIRHEDAKAMTMLKTDADAFRELYGRAPSAHEIDGMAAHIRENWHDRNHRPSDRFHRRIEDTRAVSLDRSVFDDGSDTLGDTLAGEETTPLAHVDLSQVTGQQLDQAFTRSRIPAPAVLSIGRAADLRSQVSEPAREIARFRTGALYNPQVFEPWGNPDDEARKRIADRLIATGDLADQMWHIAVDRASGVPATHIKTSKAA